MVQGSRDIEQDIKDILRTRDAITDKIAQYKIDKEEFKK